MHKALSIAGFDPTGGAGVLGDIKTFHSIGVYGFGVVTAITIQDTHGVYHVEPLTPSLIEGQIDALAKDAGIDYAKTGVLVNKGIVEVVSKCVERWGFSLVIDPVISPKSGVRLLDDEGVEALKGLLLPKAKVVTPNAEEASRLSGFKVDRIDEAIRAARVIAEEYHPEAVVIKCGHLKGDECIDVLYLRDKARYRLLRGPRIEGDVHGGGCVFSAALTAYLALGRDVEDATRLAKEYSLNARIYALKVGSGYPVANASWKVEKYAFKYEVLSELRKALSILERHGELIANLIPEVQSNLVYALPALYAKGLEDVAGVPGRIVRVGNRVRPMGEPAFGASRHVANYVLTAMKFNPSIRAAMNIRFDRRVLKAAEELGLRIGFFDRREEPPEVKLKEGASIPWGVETVVKRLGFVPDLIYHEGDWGKEPMAVILGESPIEVVRRVIEIAKKIGLTS